MSQDDLFGGARTGGPSRKQVLHELIQIRRRIERMIAVMANDSEHRDYITKIMTGDAASTKATRYEGPEDASVVMARFGIEEEPILLEDIPAWFRERFGDHLD